MQIQGTFYDVIVDLQNQESNIIELKVLKNNEVTYLYEITNSTEINQQFQKFLESQKITIPQNRYNQLLKYLEGEYETLYDKIHIKNATLKIRQQELQSLNKMITKGGDTQKFLIMGLSGAGKTSIYQVLFEGKLPHETRLLTPTRGTDRHEIKIYNSIPIEDPQDSSKLNYKKIETQVILWDLGGQTQFITRYFDDPERYFRQSNCLIFIIDAYDIDHFEDARVFFHKTIKLMQQYGIRPPHLTSQESNIFCLIHKMDLFPDKTDKFNYLINYFNTDPSTNQPVKNINFIATSIFDSTIFAAWNKISRTIIPKSSKLNIYAQELKEVLNIYSVLVIERRTGLPICNSKLLQDESVLVGDSNRILITVDRLLGSFNLASIQKIDIATANGTLEFRIFNQNYVLILIYPSTFDINGSKIEERIKQFMNTMQGII